MVGAIRIALFFISFTKVVFANVNDTLSEAIPFIIVNNNIVLQITDKQGQDLNIIFDSASNAFLLDSAVAERLGVRLAEKKGGAAFMNGTVDAALFANQSIFDSQLLNKLYSLGNSLSLKLMSDRLGMRVDGLIGLGDHLRITASIDFEKQCVHLQEQPFEPKDQDSYLKMELLYTDAGHEGQYSKMLRRVPACEVRLTISEGVEVKTNLHFDTGFNRKFAFLTTLDVDSFLVDVKKPISRKIKKTSLGDQQDSLYYTSADSIFIGDLDKNYATDIVISQASHMAIAGFGTLDWMCLCGTEFLKSFREVHFDLINRKIFLRE